METKKIKQVVGGLFVAASLMVPIYSNAANKCVDVLSVAAKAELENRIYAKGTNPSNVEGYMRFGYESEYLFSESGPILEDYAPAPDVMPLRTWKRMTSEARIEWIKNRFLNAPGFATGAGLFKVNNTLTFMPNELIVDSTGNIEIVIDPPISNYKEWAKMVDQIVERYGAGSQQAMVSKARETAYPTVRNEKLEKQHLGWMVYTNLFDMFDKLKSGAARYQRDQTKLTALSFDHPFVGPMTKMKRDVLETYIAANAVGDKYHDRAKDYVRKRDSSFKYTGGPSYRPDIASLTSWAWEIRNAHKDVADIKNKVARDIRAHVAGLDVYESFGDVPAFDSEAEFDKLNTPVQNMLKTLFPSKADPRFASYYSHEDHIALESYRNFSMPMADMKKLIAALESNPAKRREYELRSQRARLNYVNGIEVVKNELATNRMTVQQAKARVMGLLGIWSVETGVFELFENKARQIGHDPKYSTDAVAAAHAG